MSVKSFYKAHIDTIEKSLLSLDFDDVNLFVDLILNCKGKIFFLLELVRMDMLLQRQHQPFLLLEFLVSILILWIVFMGIWV